MEKKNVFDRRSVKLEEILKPGYIGFMEGRPKRERVINPEDITNLSILLNTSKSLDEFVKLCM